MVGTAVHPPRLLVPPGVTFKDVNRTHLVEGISLSLSSTKRSLGVLSAWRCSNGTLDQVSTEGLSFVGFANNSENRTTLYISPNGNQRKRSTP